jgi:hypothetical protein
MSAGSITRMLAESSEIILRWSDTPLAPARESLVELVHPDDAEPLVRAPFRIGEDTPVTLVAKGCMVNGIVRFCRAEKQSYLIAVSTCGISEEQSETVHFRDPGALAVDDFLTEEEEAKILESLQGLFRIQTRKPVLPTPFVFRAARQLWSYTAALFVSPSAARPSCTCC